MTGRDAAISMKEMTSTAGKDTVPSNGARRKGKANPSAPKDRSITVHFPAVSAQPKERRLLLLKTSSAVS